MTKIALFCKRRGGTVEPRNAYSDLRDRGKSFHHLMAKFQNARLHHQMQKCIFNYADASSTAKMLHLYSLHFTDNCWMHRCIFNWKDASSTAQMHLQLHRCIFNCKDVSSTGKMHPQLHRCIFNCTDASSTAQMHLQLERCTLNCKDASSTAQMHP